MRRESMCSLDAKSASVEDVLYILLELNSMAPKGAVVYVESQMAGDITAGTLYSEKLTDGSEVYTIQLR